MLREKTAASYPKHYHVSRKKKRKKKGNEVSLRDWISQKCAG
jgi:hypothetical protein